uniref:NADH-ubiquinone oxidoreductase chain 5 n=1 Tax=Myrianida brachycephala TaxID=884646 RepID=A0A1C9UZD7_MYRBC|nr:NADH dehydrogenase subunit 5 [Myrianida brachycephala]AOR87133.1 NADH dehydrogenase subunit 5 [Myrianida brachycephala]
MLKFIPNPLKSFYIILASWSLFSTFAALTFNSGSMLLLSYTFFNLNSNPITLNIVLDMYSMLFSGVVLFISSNIMLFSMFYMKGDPSLLRFSYLVLGFIMSMNLLIFIPNLITLLIGWDGLGIISFILVIYYQNNKSLAAGMITAMTNRIGDVLILGSIGMILSQSHWSISFMWVESLHYPITISILLLLAFCTKSAQIPFSAWLPAAMAAPTPVSALVHSSTLVTAGIFLLFRFHPFLSSLKYFNFILMTMSLSTMLMAGLAAVVENDMKKIIALSTLSQLGVMATSLALNLPMFAFFHLITHALFKALLFICAGVLINFHSHGQDLRTMGNIYLKLPLTTTSMIIANLALCGFPFMAGFFSKDLIIESSLFQNFNMFFMLGFMLATMLTALYSFRFLIILFSMPLLASPFSNLNDNLKNTLFAMFIMSIMAIMGGAMFSWSWSSLNTEPMVPMMFKYLTPMMIMLGSSMGVMISMLSFFPMLTNNLFFAHFYLTSMWGLVVSSSFLTLPNFFHFSFYQLKTIDQGWTEIMGPKGMISISPYISSNISKPQNMIINSSIMLMCMSMSLIFLF